MFSNDKICQFFVRSVSCYTLFNFNESNIFCPKFVQALVGQKRTLDKNPPRDIIILLIGAEFVQGSPAGPQHCSPEFVPGRLWKKHHFSTSVSYKRLHESAPELPGHFEAHPNDPKPNPAQLILDQVLATMKKRTTSVHQLHTKDCTKVLWSYPPTLEHFLNPKLFHTINVGFAEQTCLAIE